jgi:hypothetical protein
MAPPADTAHAGLAALERLRHIAETVQDTADGEWFALALGRYTTGAADGVKLEEVFGLAVSQGGVPWWLARRRAERDRLLRELAGIFTGPAWSRAQAVADALRRYQSTAWRHDKARGGPLTSDPRRKMMFDIFAADERPPPTGVRRIYDIVSA